MSSKADVLVVLAQVGFRGRREDWLGQFVGLLQAGGQRDAADGAGGLVILPARTDQVTAHHRFDHDRLQAFRNDRAAAHLLRFAGGDHAFRRHAGQVVRHDVAEFLEPEIGHLVQDHALARNWLVHDDVERGQAVGRDDQDLVVADGVIVTYLAAAEQWQGVDGGCVEAVHRRDIRKAESGTGGTGGTTRRCRNTDCRQSARTISMRYFNAGGMGGRKCACVTPATPLNTVTLAQARAHTTCA